MLAKKTTKNQITLPKKVIARFSGVEYFDVSTDGACIILRPLQKSRADEVRARLSQLAIAAFGALLSQLLTIDFSHLPVPYLPVRALCTSS